MQKTLVLIKPDAIQRSLIGNIITRFEQKGLKLIGMKMLTVEDILLAEHYAHVADAPFFEGMKIFMKSTPIIAICWEGLEAVSVVRRLCGTTNAREADVGSIRGDFSMSTQFNAVHASDSEQNAETEIKRFFAPEELFSYNKNEFFHLYSKEERERYTQKEQ
jgi:nucleoside-diphosphate kinase